MRALVTAAVWLVVVVVLRMLLSSAFDRYERRLAETDPTGRSTAPDDVPASSCGSIVAIVVVIGTWSVLSIFPATQQVASAFLGSAAVLAVIAGLALSTPLGNLGSGVLLAFTQPVRLGDRITVQDHTGIVDQISLSYTALATDEGRRIFVPNTTMVSTILVNRSVDDPRRLVTVDVPVRLGASLGEARRITQEAASTVPQGDELAIYVQVGDVTERTAWLHVVAYAPFGADVSHVASEIREQTIAALASADLLPA